jgi:hypothetical protein
VNIRCVEKHLQRGNTIRKYESSIKSDKFLLVVHGMGDELAQAKDILKSAGHEVSVHPSN